MTLVSIEEDGVAVVYELFGEVSVQALGSIGNREFYFRARHSDWEFEVALEDGRLATDVGIEPVFLQRGHEADAGYMPTKRAKEIILACVRTYLKQLQP